MCAVVLSVQWQRVAADWTLLPGHGRGCSKSNAVSSGALAPNTGASTAHLSASRRALTLMLCVHCMHVTHCVFVFMLTMMSCLWYALGHRCALRDPAGPGAQPRQAWKDRERGAGSLGWSTLSR